MRNLFRSFERFGVEYLLISGQASVLYGAATFSEDIDLWVRPTPTNIVSLGRALAACRARAYKRTPPLIVRHFRRGHGFHFTLPARPDPVYLDIMGSPPRVGSFKVSQQRAEHMKTGWGVLPVVSLRDLIALKKTRRLYDYEVISNLVQIQVSRCDPPPRSLLEWGFRETFRAEDRLEFARQLGLQLTVAQCRRHIGREMQRHQGRDVAYWRPILRELRELRRRGQLLAQGDPLVPVG
ncbi:MAG TPA: hypothetical protein VMU54_04040 [Planctomycetota bacterium]|nr:hypothetical protein [Planctomycetota bacterium]